MTQKKKTDKKQGNPVIKKQPPNTIWINPIDIQRIRIDGKEYVVRKVLNVTPDEIVVEDHTGTIRVIKRQSEKQELIKQLQKQEQTQKKKQPITNI